MAEEFENQQDQQQEDQQEQQEERTFTQADVDKIINKKYAAWKKTQPSDEDMAAFREWKAKQEPEKKGPTQNELDSALAEYEMTRRENYLLRKGVDPEDVDYYVYRISKDMDGETDFEDAAEEYFKKHKPRSANQVKFDTGARFSGSGNKKSPNEAMNAIIRNAKK